MEYMIAHDIDDVFGVLNLSPFRLKIGDDWPVIYRGKYIQCLVVVGALNLGKTTDEAIKLAEDVTTK